MTIRLRGKLIGLVDVHKDNESYFELFPLSQKPQVGDEVLLLATIKTISEHGNPVFNRDAHEIVAILPKDEQTLNTSKPTGLLGEQKEEKACFCLWGDPTHIHPDCPIHGKKMEKKMECQCPPCPIHNPKESS